MEPAPELEKHTGACTSHSSLALLQFPSRETQPFSTGEQKGLCLSPNSPKSPRGGGAQLGTGMPSPS